MTRSASRSQHPQHSSGDISAAVTTAGTSSTLGSSGFFAGAGAPATDVLPSKISKSLRFIARHMICVSRRPDAPTTPPTATRSGSPIAIPAIDPATPENELSKEIVIGMSAPPTRMAKIMPKAPDKITQPSNKTIFTIALSNAPGTANKTTVASERTSVRIVQNWWFFRMIGF